MQRDAPPLGQGGINVSAGGLRPHPDDQSEPNSHFLTFVLPAPDGCNLKCPFCIVRQRREITETRLRPDDLVRFIREAYERAPIYALAIQGYEPLLTTSLPYTQAILATGRLLRIPTSLVTNGVLLSDALDLLTVLAPSKISISLDAASAADHDRLRGVAGAWEATVRGLTRAAEVLLPQTRVVVSSVLLPGQRRHLDGVPALLRDIGIERWIVNPLLRVGRGHVGGPIGDRASLFRDLELLQAAAERAGVRLTVDDEFGSLGEPLAGVGRHKLHVRALPADMEIFRLAPSGQCSRGADILRQVTSDTPRWQPGVMHAGEFLQALAAPTIHRRRSMA
jgi:MoaA/NifB/PqqE/SkfB family radical SAM enzyme